jgi:ParB family chromosome partitioning protein
MVEKVKQEACQLYIEQQIDEGLAKGWTAYQIGKEVAQWLEKLFEVRVLPRTIEQRARRQENATNVASDLTPLPDNGIKENQEIKVHGGRRDGAGRPPKFKVVEPAHRTQFTGENEWYTPIKYIELVRDVLGEIDIDPATSGFGQNRIQAKKHYTKETNGLKHGNDWHGRMWLNPPYAQPLIQQFTEKTILEIQAGRIQEAIILTHNYTDTQWFHLLNGVADLICFTRGRIKFELQDGTIASPTQGSAFFYVGENKQKFIKVFNHIGFIR